MSYPQWLEYIFHPDISLKVHGDEPKINTENNPSNIQLNVLANQPQSPPIVKPAPEVKTNRILNWIKKFVPPKTTQLSTNTLQQIAQLPPQQQKSTLNPLFNGPTVPSQKIESPQASQRLHPQSIPINTPNSVNSTTKITQDFIRIKPDEFVRVVFDQLLTILNNSSNENTKFRNLINDFKQNISNVTSQKEIQPDQEKSEIYYEILVGFFIRIAYMLIDTSVTNKQAEFTKAYTFLCKAYEKLLDNPQKLIDQIKNCEEKENCQEAKLAQEHSVIYADLNKQIEGLVSQVADLQAKCPDGDCDESDDELECEDECEEGKKKDDENGLNDTISNEIAILKKTITEKQSEIQTNQTEIDRLKGELRKLQANTTQTEASKKEKDQLTKQLAALEAAQTEHTTQIQKLTNAAQAAKTQLEQTQKNSQVARNAAQTRASQDQAAIAAKNAEIAQLKGNAATKNAKIKGLLEENSEAAKAKADANAKAAQEANLQKLNSKQTIYNGLIETYNKLKNDPKLSQTGGNSAFKDRFDKLKEICPLLFVNQPTTEDNSLKTFDTLKNDDVLQVIDQIDILNQELINLSEDVNGSVRVIVRIKPLIFKEGTETKVMKFNKTTNQNCEKSSIIPIFTEQKGGACNDNIPFDSDYPQSDLAIVPFEKFKVRITDTLENLVKITAKGAKEAAEALKAANEKVPDIEIIELEAAEAAEAAKAAKAEAAEAAEAAAAAEAAKPKRKKNVTPQTITYYKRYRNYYNIFSDPPFSNFGTYSGIPFIKDNFTIDPSTQPLSDYINTTKNSDPIKKYYQESNLRTSFEQVKQGYSIVLFGYGYSGSGKTFTLLGSGDTKGVLQYGIEDMKYDKVELAYVFEEYSDVTITESNGQLKITKLEGKIYQLYGDKLNINQITPILEKFTKDFEKDFEKDFTSDFTQKFTNMSDEITKLRKEAKNPRIKATINNPESSRSHLYIIFKVTHQDKTGFITIIDMAGRENPIKIIERLTPIKTTDTKPLIMLNQLLTYNIFTAMESCIKESGQFNYGSGSDYIPCKYDNNIKAKINNYISTINTINTITDKDTYIKAIINEGFYINESINHLKYYLKNKADDTFTVKNYNTNTDLTNYNPENYYINVSPTSSTKTIIPHGNCLTIPILQFLDTGLVNNLEKPTKFIMICAIRQEPSYANDVIDTLAFADSIKST